MENEIKVLETKLAYDSCPNCESENIEWGNLEDAGGEIFRKATCLDCYFEWFEVYPFSFSEFHDENAELMNEILKRKGVK